MLRRLLTANHADGRNGRDPMDTRACERPVGTAGARLTLEQRRAAALAPQQDAWWCDPDWDRHGLAWFYPHLLELVGTRTTKGRSGGGGGIAVPIDLLALDFLTGRYWASEFAPSETTLDDPDNYRPGFVVTLRGLERSVCRALRLTPRPRPTAEGLGIDDGVLDTLAFLALHADQLVDEAPMLAETVRSEALRLLGRAAAMVLGNRFTASVNECMYCYQQTVVADEDRAVCRNPDCRRGDGTRRCWRFQFEELAGEERWVEVDEPDVRGRGRLSDEQLSRWTEAG